MLVLAMLAAQGLDAPVEARPTVRTEIHRGYLAADACMDASRMEHAMRFFDCITTAEKLSQGRMGATYQPFAAGLYYGAKMDGKVIADVAGRSKLFTPQEAGLLRSNEEFYQHRYEGYRDELRLTDKDLELAALIGS